MIKLGITGGLLAPDDNRNIFAKKQLCYLEKDFANYWASFGVLPILIPNLDEQHLFSFLEQLDGLALMGGTDIAPQEYQEFAVSEMWQGDPLRDAYELKILDWFVQQKRPVFGICRGFQLLNVYFGGSLYQDLPSQYPSYTAHSNLEYYDLHCHNVKLVPNTFWQALKLDEHSNLVNSVHHQGIKQLAPSLLPLAHAEDGLVEAFYHKDIPEGKIMGVQWHPEFFQHSSQALLKDAPIVHHFLSFCSPSNSF